MRPTPWMLLAVPGLLGGCAMRPPRLGVLLAPILPAVSATVLLAEPFEALDAARWREVEVKGRTAYAIAQDGDGGSYLTAHSRGGASVLVLPVRFDPDAYEWLSWRWRVERFPGQEDLTRKDGSDAAARVYVYFDTPGLPWQKRNLDYVWSERLPAETVLSSAFSSASKIVVARSGAEAPGAWQAVSRNIEDDYRRCFGEDPPDVVAIGLMTDADSTGTEAIAAFDDVRISRSP